MKIQLIITSIFLTFFLHTGYSQSWTQQSTGLYGGNINALISKGNTVLAATNGAGIFRSVDSGVSWSRVSEGLLDYDFTCFEIMGDTIVGGGFFSGIHYSADNGISWNSTLSEPEYQITSLLVHGDKLFAGSVRGLFVSINKGDNWTSLSSKLPGASEHPWIESIIEIGNKIIVGLSFGGGYISPDNGETWIQLSDIPTNLSVYQGIENAGLFYLGTSKGVYVSANEGANWSRVGAGIPDTHIYDLGLKNNALFAATVKGLYSSVDNGSNWTKTTLPKDFSGAVNCIHSFGDNIFLGGYGVGIIRSSDNGSSWNFFNDGLTALKVRQLVKSGEYLLASTPSDIFRSKDGLFWINIGKVNGNFANDILAKGDSLLTTQDRTVLYSTNHGDTWNSFSSHGLSNEPPILKYVHDGDIYASAGKLYAFRNESWVQLIDNGDHQSFHRMTETNDKLYASSNLRLYASEDEGITWSDRTGNLPLGNGMIRTMQGVNDHLFVAIEDDIYKSKDLESEWMNTDFEVSGTIREIYNFNNYVFVGAFRNGIHFSPDMGETWIDINSEMTRTLSPNVIYHRADTLFVGTDEGIWVSSIKNYYPKIQSFEPKIAKVGENVNIKGKNFSSNLENNLVTLNGKPVEVLVANPETIIFKVPVGAESGTITISLNGQSAESIDQLCVKPEMPIISISEDSNRNIILSSTHEAGNQWYFNGNPIEGANDKSYTLSEYGIYTVRVELKECNSEFSEAYNYVLLGLNETEKFEVFPIPTSDELNINFHGFNQSNKIDIQLYDTSGRLVHNFKSQGSKTATLNMTKFKSGVYLLSVIQGTNRQNGRVIKLP